MNNMTALVSCFARAYHRWANVVPVFDDTAAEALLGEDFRQIAQNMQQGAAFFLPGLHRHTGGSAPPYRGRAVGPIRACAQRILREGIGA